MERILFRNGKVLNVDEVAFSRQNMFCEVARSYLKVDLKQHD
jgi:hypothetical protein